MKSSAIFSLSPPSLFSSRPNAKTKTLPLGTCLKRASQPTQLHCAKMFVPGFGEASPEAKAANNLHNFFTYIAVKIVAAQLESYNPEAYEDLMEFLQRHSLNNGDDFCATLMRKSFKHKSLALRILEVRSVYCKNDFDWEKLKQEAARVRNTSSSPQSENPPCLILGWMNRTQCS